MTDIHPRIAERMKRVAQEKRIPDAVSACEAQPDRPIMEVLREELIDDDPGPEQSA